MANQTAKYLVTGASGQLGALAVEALLARVPAGNVVALVRRPEAAAPLEAKGIEVRIGDYTDRAALERAFNGIDRLLLISSSEIGQRAPQHINAIEAAKAAGVGFIAYTSILHADTSPLMLAEEHRVTEDAIRASGIPYALLRNGWYTENKTGSVAAAIEHGAYIGAAGEGRISSATRRDYAEAAVAVLTADETAGNAVHELAGDESYSMAEFAAEIARAAGKPVAYRDMSQAEHAAALEAAGLPGPFAAILADSDAGTAKGALEDDSRTLSALIGRPTTPWRETVAEAVRAAV
ncbi:SDR family oxidoreductase [Oricola thermophila]|uniref:SDR family oxidoreductase n=1 Tax=Oricola thermophila TaxID=2742145 RepID=A0A6N1VCN5_9HYPH|nr:SDR family oxidoreductase [Oricola thermophila]QKV18640.1 SDR family oxidoreductase [Oricola thermophila]